MTKNEFFVFMEQFYSECLETSKKKNDDYTSGSEDPFSNFSSVETLGIKTIDGFLTRMMDKMKRVASFAHRGELSVKDESVIDTLRDLANYSCLLAGYIESKKVKEVKGYAGIVSFPGITGLSNTANSTY